MFSRYLALLLKRKHTEGIVQVVRMNIRNIIERKTLRESQTGQILAYSRQILESRIPSHFADGYWLGCGDMGSAWIHLQRKTIHMLRRTQKVCDTRIRGELM